VLKRLALVLSVTSALAADAFAADRKVPTVAHPTIAAAVAAAQPGDRILVGPGVYQEHVVAAAANLQFIGNHAVWDATLPNGTHGDCLTVNAGGVQVRGFSFRGGNGVSRHLVLTGDGCSVRNCVSRGPAGFLTVTGARAAVEACRIFAGGSVGIDVVGDDARIERSSMAQCDAILIRITGARGEVSRCRFLDVDSGDVVQITGPGALVLANQFVNCDDDTIDVTGDGAVVEGNKLTGSGDLRVTGDNLAIRRNTLKFVFGGAQGIFAASTTLTGAGVIEDNVVADSNGRGLDVGAHHVTVRRNTISRAGADGSEGCVRVGGTFNTLERNVAVSSGAHGYDITGADNTIVDCVALDADGDGFHVVGARTRLDRCRASGCTGEGLDNGATETTVLRCTFKGNRIDVANDGTFTNFALDNVFKTGGTGQPPQVD
jgi:nitrous oxidase accessory protein NosD